MLKLFEMLFDIIANSPNGPNS